MELSYFLIYVSNLVICYMVGFVLLFTRAPKLEANRSYINAKRYVAFTSILTGTACLISLINGEAISMRVEVFNFFLQIVFYLIIVVFLFAMLSLYYSRISNRLIIYTLFPPVLMTLVYFILRIVGFPDYSVYSMEMFVEKIPDSPTMIIRVIMELYTVVMLVYAMICVRKAQTQYRDMIDQFFSETQKMRGEWVNSVFLIGGGLGVFVQLNFLTPVWYVDAIITLLTTIFYVVFGVLFINYQYMFNTLNLILDNYADTEEALSDANVKPEVMDKRLQEIDLLLSQWTAAENKPYLKAGLSLEEVANQIHVDTRNLSRFINMRFSKNFNAWINDLRVEEVVRLMHFSDLNLTEIADKTGFSDLPMMSRVFKKIKGVSPTAFLNSKV